MEDHRDVAVARRDVVDDAVADSHDALGDLLEAGDHSKRRRLPTPRWADEHHEFAVGNREVEVVHRNRIVGVLLRQVLERDGRHAWILKRRTPKTKNLQVSSVLRVSFSGGAARSGLRQPV